MSGNDDTETLLKRLKELEAENAQFKELLPSTDVGEDTKGKQALMSWYCSHLKWAEDNANKLKSGKNSDRFLVHKVTIDSKFKKVCKETFPTLIDEMEDCLKNSVEKRHESNERKRKDRESAEKEKQKEIPKVTVIPPKRRPAAKKEEPKQAETEEEEELASSYQDEEKLKAPLKKQANGNKKQN